MSEEVLVVHYEEFTKYVERRNEAQQRLESKK